MENKELGEKEKRKTISCNVGSSNEEVHQSLFYKDWKISRAKVWQEGHELGWKLKQQKDIAQSSRA